MDAPFLIGIATAMLMCCFFLFGIKGEIGVPVCQRYEVEWKEASSYVEVAQKHRPTIHVPAHWQSTCSEWR